MHLHNTGQYCDIALKIMLMLQNVGENCVRQVRMFVILSYGILIDKSTREKPKIVRTLENIAAVTESECEMSSTSIHRHYF